MSIISLKKFLSQVEKMENAGISIPDNLLQAIDSLAEQLKPFLKNSHQKAEFDEIETRDLIIDIYLSLWRIFYEDIYQKTLLEHLEFCKIIGDPIFYKDYSIGKREEDIRIRLTQIHEMLVSKWKSSIPPSIEQICLPAGLLNSEMLYSYATDGIQYGKEPEYGYQTEPSLTPDARPLSLEEYIKNKNEKDISDWIEKCYNFTSDRQSYNFMCNSESNTSLGKKAMEMFGSMTYEEIFKLLNKEHCISNHFWIHIDD